MSERGHSSKQHKITSEISILLVFKGIFRLFGAKCGYSLRYWELYPYSDWAFCQPKKTEGGGIFPPPNLAVSSQMAMRLGKNILWVEIFRD